jgi:radical SAM protein with 4Fe4S-binding SPASM domain
MNELNSEEFDKDTKMCKECEFLDKCGEPCDRYKEKFLRRRFDGERNTEVM